ncbi:MAG TPA: ATP-binding protein [Acidobacteriaceae bacterium]|jgi:signal transduction histidine kinase|nr:ATP-binding protein [Acidobacteriaceae bacterium]
MSLRQRLLAMFSLTVMLAVAAVTWIVSLRVRDAYNAQEQRRTAALVTQFRREFARSGTDVVQRLERMASSQETYRMGFDLTHGGDPSVYLTEATSLAHEYGLDLLEIVGPEGNIVSSAQWPARFGYPEPVAAFGNIPSFLKRENLPDGSSQIALYAVRPIKETGPAVSLAGGMKLDRDFLASLSAPVGMQVVLYPNFSSAFDPAALASPAASAANPSAWQPIVDHARQSGQDEHALVYPTTRREDSLDVTAVPLKDPQGGVIAVLLIANERRELAEMQQHIRNIAYSVAGIGVLLAVAASLWIAARISRPIEHLARAVQEVAGGNWDTTVDIRSRDEVGQLAAGFNHMTAQLTEQRDRLVQSERVAAWRELARRLAHELKNPLFPLQLTIENLVRSRQLSESEFEEVFQESTTTLMAELQNLKTIIGRFSDFSKMPKPQLHPEDIHQALRRLSSLYAPALEEKKIALRTEVPDSPLMVLADAELLHRALSNLVLNAMDAMPDGGTLTLSAAPRNGAIEIRIADTGAGLTPEECDRLFTPYYTTKQHGTGLGLAVVQSIIADHHGTISVRTASGGGAEFVIELPAHPKEAHA